MTKKEIQAEVNLLDSIQELRSHGRTPKQIVKTVLALLFLTDYKLVKKEDL